MREVCTLLVLASGCVMLAQADTSTPVQQLTGSAFSVCHQHGCANVSRLHLSADDAQAIVTAFGPVAATAAAERQAIARSIARFEQLVGPRTGTDRDRGGTFPGAFRNGQLDCIDEATNTTTYLRLLQQAGLLHWHRIDKTRTRFPIPRGWWPHTSAVIVERETDQHYAVDAWFHANGAAPEIIDLQRWRRGWKPAPNTDKP